MPQGETFYNPYRWVRMPDQPVVRRPPRYHHAWQGLAGHLECALRALTPLLISAGPQPRPERFIRNAAGQPYIPGTSLKGMIRALAEVLGNAAIPFDERKSEAQPGLNQASQGEGTSWQLDVVARMFGYLRGGQHLAGLVRFSDGRVRQGWKECGPFRVVVGQPRPESHTVFYPGPNHRKFYHHHYHHYGRNDLVLAPSHIRQDRLVQPLASGACFDFRVDFTNLSEEELALLLYCLVLEEDVQVTLSSQALAPPDNQSLKAQPVTFRGPLRHKLGSCKPHGAGSVHIQVHRLVLRPDPAQRYRSSTGGSNGPAVLEGAALAQELQRRTAGYAQRNDQTIRELRAMLIYSEHDPRREIHYPSYEWFDEHGKVPLKPTL